MNLTARRANPRTSSNGAASAVLDPPEPASAAPVPAAKPANVTPSSALDEFAGDPNFMTSLARGLLVIQSFTPQTPHMTISQLSVRTGLSRAAVRL